MNETLNLFKALVVDDQEEFALDLSFLRYGYILTFRPNNIQKKLLEINFRNMGVTTLFSATEARETDLLYKVEKQFLSYAASYWLDNPLMFVEYEGQIFTLSVISAITVSELQALIDPILYGNKPAKNVTDLLAIINNYNLNFDFSKIKNNEVRVGLYNEDDPRTVFTSGDDVVRYIVWKTTASTLLIKSREVLAGVKLNSGKISALFLEKNAVLLSQVFNRHKNVILSLKDKHRTLEASLINKISRLSKVNHKPLPENMKLTILARKDFDTIPFLSIRERFRLLNHIEYIKSGAPSIFTIRNGKLWFAKDHTRLLSEMDMIEAKMVLFSSLKKDLAHLRDKVILLPKEIDYGLPISQKQAFGNLPWGTTVTVKDRLSSGIFWKNSWGANDLDLSTLDQNGNRVGWGQWNGYNSKGDILFSGDLVQAPDPKGAMEFMTSSTKHYGLFVNVFHGDKARCEVVVGDTVEGQWIKHPIIQEEVSLNEKGAILGYVHNKQITLFSASINNKISTLSGKSGWSLDKRHAFSWTVKKLLKELDIKFEEGYDDLVKKENVINLSYSGFTFDKLENLFF